MHADQLQSILCHIWGRRTNPCGYAHETARDGWKMTDHSAETALEAFIALLLLVGVLGGFALTLYVY